MRYKRTQVYLDPEDHRWLSEEAGRRGMSLTALLREIVSRVTRDARPAKPHAFESIIGIVEGEDPTDIAHKKDEYLDEYLDELYEKKMGRTDTPAHKRRMQ